MKLQKFAHATSDTAADLGHNHSLIPKIIMKISTLTDKELFELCREYGTKALLWRKKFIGLLPEVNRRELYKTKGCSSIFEFAAKLCGLSQEQVRLTLNLEKRFEDKPALKALLVNGEESINKLARIVSIATPENEQELAVKIKVLSKSALDTWVRDTKRILADNGYADGLQEPFFDIKSLPGHASLFKNWQTPLAGQTSGFQIADDVQQEFDELHAKGIDVNELLREMLKQRKEKIAATKEEIGEAIHSTTSRYIAVKIRKILREEHGDKCSIAPCQKLATIIHHTQRFSLSQNHDPRFLAPMCREHHAIAHSVDIKYQRARDRSSRNKGWCGSYSPHQ